MVNCANSFERFNEKYSAPYMYISAALYKKFKDTIAIMQNREKEYKNIISNYEKIVEAKDKIISLQDVKIDKLSATVLELNNLIDRLTGTTYD